MVDLIFDGIAYNSLAFLAFLFGFLGVFFIVPQKWMKVGVIVAGNIFFYLHAAGIGQLVVVVISCVVVYVFSRIIEKIYKEGLALKGNELSAWEEVEYWKPYKKKCRKWLVISVFLLLFTLVYTKVGRILGWEEISNFSELRFGRIIIPLGLSYYTFSSIGYLVDIYKRKIGCVHNPVVLFATITFFPIIVEGPISKIDSLSKQFREIPQFDYNRLCFGLQRMLWGLFKKIVIADRIMPVTSYVYSNIFDFAGVEILICLLLGTFAFYADFSGCMDIVIGVAEAMGIVLEENFKQPFFSESIMIFWRRWHITLFSWFREYIYMPVAKTPLIKKISKISRRIPNKELGQAVTTVIPTFIVWVITGLWHGTGIFYIVWGGYWFALMTISAFTSPFWKRVNTKLGFRSETFGWKLFRILRTDLLYTSGGILIVSGTSYGLHGCIYILKQLFLESRIWMLFNGSIFEHGMDRNNFTIVIIGVIMVLIVEGKQNNGFRVREVISEQPILFRWLIWIGLIVAVLIWGQYGPGYTATEFLYRGF